MVLNLATGLTSPQQVDEMAEAGERGPISRRSEPGAVGLAASLAIFLVL